MANRTKTDNAREAGKVRGPHSKDSQPSSNRSQTNDDLILTLSAAYENKRAQQVSEWQSLQPMVMRRAA